MVTQSANTCANRKPHPLMITQLSGTQSLMGAQHGAMVRAAGGWEPVMGYYPKMSEILLAGNSPLAQRAVRPLLQAGTASLERVRDKELRDRTRAFMAALGLSPQLSRHYQTFDVFQNLVNTAGRYRIGPFAERIKERAPAACSTLAVWGETSKTGEMLHARNFDFPGVGIWERLPAVVFCTPKGGLRYGFVTIRGADVPGVSAFNEAGLSITTHTRFHRDVQWRGQSVVDLVHDIARTARTLADAEALIRRRKVASSWSLLVSSASEREARAFEVCGSMVRVLAPGQGESHMAATNRYNHPDMKRGEVTISPAFVRNSDGRYNALIERARRGEVGVRDLQMLLGSYEDSEMPGLKRAAGGVPAQALSVHSVVFDPEGACVHVSVGPVPTGKGPWATINWDWRSEPGFRIERFDDEPLTTHGCDRFGEGEQARAMSAFIEATAIAGQGGSSGEATRALARAVRLDPVAPTYRFMMGGAQLKAGDTKGALEQFERGLEHERSPFYRGQLLLWASRAADAHGDRKLAAALRADLLATAHPLLAEHHTHARDEMRAPMRPENFKKLRMLYQLADLRV